VIGKLSDARLLAGAALVLPSIGMIAPLGVAPLLAVVAPLLLVVEKRRPTVLHRPLGALTILLAAMALWGAASSSWSIIPAHSLFEAGRFALISAAGLVVVAAASTLDTAGRAQVGRAALGGFVLGVGVLAVELWGGFPIHRALSGLALADIRLAKLDRGATVLSLACWVPILFLVQRGRRFAAILVFLVTLAALDRLISLSAVFGLLTAAVGFALAWWRPRATALLMAGGFAVLLAVMPIRAPTRDTVLWLSEVAPWLRTSAQHRLIIWRFTDDRIAEKPLLGWGMDASRAIPGGKTSVRVYMSLPDSIQLEGDVMPLHPHDAILQWTVELGVVGTLLGGAIILCLAWLAGVAGGATRATRAIGLATFAGALPPLLLSFGIWQAWWQSTLWIAAALVVATGDRPDTGAAVPKISA
jgi:exopolysaccharide production protein ExoQ